MLFQEVQDGDFVMLVAPVMAQAVAFSWVHLRNTRREKRTGGELNNFHKTVAIWIAEL